MLETMISQVEAIVKCTELKQSKQLVIGMLLTSGHKNCVSMAKPLGISHDVLQKIFDASPKSIDELQLFLVLLVLSYYNKDVKSWLIIDDTALAKAFAQVYEGLGFVYDSCKQGAIKGYKIVALCWTNGKITIPLAFRFWLLEDNACLKHNTKLDLARELILEYKNKVEFHGIIADGLYSSYDMMNFFEDNNLTYYMRLPKNRLVKANLQSFAFKIGDNLAFKLKGNTRSKLFNAYFGTKLRYITASKRLNRSGKYETIYIVSNEKAESKETLLIYAIRWAIEKFFRTAKQTLGIADCMARSLQKQALHIYSSFASYAILESIKLAKHFDKPEDASRYLLMIKDDFAFFTLHRFHQYSPN